MKTEEFVEYIARTACPTAASIVTGALDSGILIVATDPRPVHPVMGASFAKRLTDPTIRQFIVGHGFLTIQEWDRLWDILQAIPVASPAVELGH